MSIRGRRRLARRFGPRLERILHTAPVDPESQHYCPGSGQSAFWAKARTGECPVCFGTHRLDPNPDGGPGAVLAAHERTNR